MPFRTAFPDSGSISVVSASTLLLTPAWSRATSSRTPGASWPQPCGIDTTPVADRVGHLDRRLDRAGLGREPRALPVDQAEPVGVGGVHVHGAAVLALHERPQVVHPGVVRAQLAAADQHEVAVAASLERRAQPLDVGDDRLGRELDLARRRAQHLGDARLRAGRGRSRAGSPRARPASARRARRGGRGRARGRGRAGHRAPRGPRRDRGPRAATAGRRRRAGSACRSRTSRSRRGRRPRPGRSRSR